MQPWIITEQLAREHVADLRGRPALQPMFARPPMPDRSSIGWWLVDKGMKLVASRQPAPGPARRPAVHRETPRPATQVATRAPCA
ncbi:MAG: hypothetical protein ACRDWW_01470 [Acidimicrobiales bacterium]